VGLDGLDMSALLDDGELMRSDEGSREGSERYVAYFTSMVVMTQYRRSCVHFTDAAEASNIPLCCVSL
jgi:hypothetical protein